MTKAAGPTAVMRKAPPPDLDHRLARGELPRGDVSSGGGEAFGSPIRSSASSEIFERSAHQHLPMRPDLHFGAPQFGAAPAPTFGAPQSAFPAQGAAGGINPFGMAEASPAPQPAFAFGAAATASPPAATAAPFGFGATPGGGGFGAPPAAPFGGFTAAWVPPLAGCGLLSSAASFSASERR